MAAPVRFSRECLMVSLVKKAVLVTRFLISSDSQEFPKSASFRGRTVSLGISYFSLSFLLFSSFFFFYSPPRGGEEGCSRVVRPRSCEFFDYATSSVWKPNVERHPARNFAHSSGALFFRWRLKASIR